MHASFFCWLVLVKMGLAGPKQFSRLREGCFVEQLVLRVAPCEWIDVQAEVRRIERVRHFCRYKSPMSEFHPDPPHRLYSGSP